jgi:CRISPR-associated protein Cmr4
MNDSTQSEQRSAAGNGVTSVERAVLLALYAETPLHPGTGQSTGVIDLPVQRERHTGFPLIPSTSLKGSLRSVAEQRWRNDQDLVSILFGPEPDSRGDLYAGALAFTDARLLAFPVRSLQHVFLWITCPLVLGRLARDWRLAGHRFEAVAIELPASGKLRVSPGFASGTVVLEDLLLQVEPSAEWSATIERLVSFLPKGNAHRVYSEKFRRHHVLANDEDFAYLVKHATSVTARIKLNQKKTTTGDGGNLWYEETIPTDSLFYELVFAESPRSPGGEIQSATDVRAKLLELLAGDPFFLQVGGNETVGQGWCTVHAIGNRRGGSSANGANT